MELRNDFSFTLNVSYEGYEKKTDATACLSSKGAEAIGRKKMCFFEETLTVDEFLDKAQSGHSFCALYRFEEGKKYWYSNKQGQKYCGYPYYQRDSKTATKGGLKIDFKRDEYFYGSQVVFIDIDNTSYTDINDYINSLTFKPTMVYMSYSDGKEKGGKVSRRFHLCYVFDSILNKDSFKEVSTTLSLALVRDTNEELEDKCGEKMSQYMNGCFGNKENYKTYSIYSLDDINNYYKEYIDNIEYDKIREEEDKSTTYYNEWQKDEQSLSEVNDAIEAENSNGTEDTEEICTSSFVNDMGRLDYDEFMKYNRHKYNYFYRVENDEWVTVTNGNYSYQYQNISEGFFQLYYNVNKVQDGNQRRKKLYQRMCLRRVMNPNVDGDTLLFNAYEDLNRFFDNSGENGANIITVDELVKNVEWAMTKSIEEIEEDFSDTLTYLRSKAPKRGKIYRFKGSLDVASRNKLIKEVNWSIIKENYEDSLSISDNCKYLNEIGISVSERTLYRFCKENEISTKDERVNIDSEMMGEYDFNLSLRKNLEILKEKGYKISLGKLSKLVKEYKDNSNNNDVIISVEEDTTRTTTYYNECQKVEHQEYEVEVNSEYDDWFSQIDRLRKTQKSSIYCPF